MAKKRKPKPKPNRWRGVVDEAARTANGTRELSRRLLNDVPKIAESAARFEAALKRMAEVAGITGKEAFERFSRVVVQSVAESARQRVLATTDDPVAFEILDEAFVSPESLRSAMAEFETDRAKTEESEETRARAQARYTGRRRDLLASIIDAGVGWRRDVLETRDNSEREDIWRVIREGAVAKAARTVRPMYLTSFDDAPLLTTSGRGVFAGIDSASGNVVDAESFKESVGWSRGGVVPRRKSQPIDDLPPDELFRTEVRGRVDAAATVDPPDGKMRAKATKPRRMLKL